MIVMERGTTGVRAVTLNPTMCVVVPQMHSRIPRDTEPSLQSQFAVPRRKFTVAASSRELARNALSLPRYEAALDRPRRLREQEFQRFPVILPVLRDFSRASSAASCPRLSRAWMAGTSPTATSDNEVLRCDRNLL